MLRSFAFVLLVSGVALAQPSQPGLHFEVCDVQASKITDPSQMSAKFLPGGRVDVRGMAMKSIIAAINKVPEDMVSGPSWMASERYDIVCKAVPTSTDDQLFEMARNMLVERFQLVSHSEKRPVQVYALEMAKKGVKLTPSTGDGHAGDCPMVPPEQGVTEPVGMVHRACHGVTMTELARMIPGMAPAYIQGLPVVDLTELKGAFNFKLDWDGSRLLHDGGGGEQWRGALGRLHAFHLRCGGTARAAARQPQVPSGRHRGGQASEAPYGKLSAGAVL
jgi:uncharacterized protein (TIGR03435 family)